MLLFIKYVYLCWNKFCPSQTSLGDLKTGSVCASVHPFDINVMNHGIDDSLNNDVRKQTPTMQHLKWADWMSLLDAPEWWYQGYRELHIANSCSWSTPHCSFGHIIIADLILSVCHPCICMSNTSWNQPNVVPEPEIPWHKLELRRSWPTWIVDSIQRINPISESWLAQTSCASHRRCPVCFHDEILRNSDHSKY